MANREVFEHDIESTPVLRNSQSANPLIRHGSEGGLKEELGRKSDSDQASLKPLQSLPSRRSNARFEGWKFTIFLAFITSVVVLSFNVGFLLYTVTHSQRNDIQRYSHQYQVEYYEHGKHHGRNTVLYEGDCEKVHHLGIGIHLLINVLSTSLLSASNYGMVWSRSNQSTQQCA